MHLRTLYLRDFRIYKEAFFEFSKHVNFIFGQNAKGKTALLEAIYLLIAGNSFRAHYLKEIIHQQSSAFYIEALFSKHGIEQKLSFSFDGKDRKIIHNHTTFSSSANLIGLLQGVVMTPDDAALVKGAPILRRRFLDIQIGQVDPLYVHHLCRYNKALRYRNYLLRMKKMQTIESWENEMAISAAYITQKRAEAVADLSVRTAEAYIKLCGMDEAMVLRYKGSFVEFNDLTRRFTALFQTHRNREMHLGTSLYGPHKDDLIITLSGLEARYFASEGQQRTCISAMKIAEWERMKTESDARPLMLVDDVAISLDASRSTQLCRYLESLEQVFITSTVRQPFECQIFEICL